MPRKCGKMLSENDIDRALSQTIELFFYKIKSDDRITWIGTITEILNQRRPDLIYNDVYNLLEMLCMDHAGKSEFKPKLGKVLRTLILGRTATDRETINAEFDSIPDCEDCVGGIIHGLLYTEPEHPEIQYFSCNCKKGLALQRPIYVMGFEDIEKYRKKHGGKFDIGPTNYLSQEEAQRLWGETAEALNEWAISRAERDQKPTEDEMREMNIQEISIMYRQGLVGGRHKGDIYEMALNALEDERDGDKEAKRKAGLAILKYRASMPTFKKYNAEKQDEVPF